MSSFKTGIFINCLKTDFSSGLKCAAALGADGIQFADRNDIFTHPLSIGDCPEYKKQISDSGLTLSAISANFNFTDGTDTEKKLRDRKADFLIAKELDCDILTGHIGVIPSDESSPEYYALYDCCRSVSEFAHSVGSYFAIETGPEKSVLLRRFIENLSSKGAAVNFDPGNLLMYVNEESASAAEILNDYIVHVHIKDAARYNFAAGEKSPDPTLPYAYECKVGAGSVDFCGVTDVLKSTGYDGFLTIERECPNNPVEDNREALEYLKSII